MMKEKPKPKEADQIRSLIEKRAAENEALKKLLKALKKGH
ncbi:hypothetical protein PEPS_14710 [Persicobacter psychrovividus]|uniref:Transcriptional regulator n=1 Tax=Persicobacter psychrovividus TaxID=387638 RepID=A0ABN6L7K5_9BACT|nr:hypothetical protein PEPS_14710 [Persicobacter psychrovividus]